MATKKVMNGIMVSPAPGKVAISFSYEEGPSDHYLLPLRLARQLIDRLEQACDLAARPLPSKATGDSVEVSEHVAMTIGAPSTRGH